MLDSYVKIDLGKLKNNAHAILEKYPQYDAGVFVNDHITSYRKIPYLSAKNNTTPQDSLLTLKTGLVTIVL